MTVLLLWGMAWARQKGQRERWITLQHILIRGNASLRILYFYIQVFHEKDFWGQLTSFPSLILGARIVPTCGLVGLRDEPDPVAVGREMGFPQQVRLVARGCLCPDIASLWSAQCWPRI